MRLRSYEDGDFDSVKQVLEETGLYVREVDTRDRFADKAAREPGSIIVAEEEGTWWAACS